MGSGSHHLAAPWDAEDKPVQLLVPAPDVKVGIPILRVPIIRKAQGLVRLDGGAVAQEDGQEAQWQANGVANQAQRSGGFQGLLHTPWLQLGRRRGGEGGKGWAHVTTIVT
jgi:hypothetical protein